MDHHARQRSPASESVVNQKVVLLELDGPASVGLRLARSVSWVGSKIIYYMCMPAASIYIKYKFVVHTYKKMQGGWA